MKLFLDTANRDAIKKWIDCGIVDGITTNPTHLSKEDPDSKKVLLDICALVPGDVSIEVVEKDPQAVYVQAKEIAALAKNVIVKIPFSQQYLPIINRLVKEGVQINVTLVFSLLQGLLVAKLGVKYISPFIGRLDDIDSDGINLVDELVQLKVQYDFESMILAASIRTLSHLHQVALAGTDVATVPPELLDKMVYHPLTEQGIAKFDADWKKLGKTKLLG